MDKQYYTVALRLWVASPRSRAGEIPTLARRVILAADRQEAAALALEIEHRHESGRAEVICCTPSTDIELSLAAEHPRGWPQAPDAPVNDAIEVAKLRSLFKAKFGR